MVKFNVRSEKQVIKIKVDFCYFLNKFGLLELKKILSVDSDFYFSISLSTNVLRQSIQFKN